MLGHEHRYQRAWDSDDDLAVFPGNWKRASPVFLKTACPQNIFSKHVKKRITKVQIRCFKVPFTTTPTLLFISHNF